MNKIAKLLEDTIEECGKKINKIEGLDEETKKILLVIAAIQISQTICKIAVENPQLIKEIYKNWVYEKLAKLHKGIKNA